MRIFKRTHNESFKKKKMKLLTEEQKESYENAKICYICKENFENKYLKDKICLRKNIFACLFSIHNKISLSCHE